ncbi:hypothetical protein CORC01_09786 [Colletotrichum orchidophilum]|uniref:Uncharacterized protein n=1 Tax=Colletotrichum orchidophilum TaxID=1209926 RepID=A0A1G4B0F6_9PEZI|nr:uncharacterized protein CORC01_09786 [Colletotrichum orchidophilum]OHE94867.1 hypothetical protein CORC01_09786 [Colletotrichum orchidophilum]
MMSRFTNAFSHAEATATLIVDFAIAASAGTELASRERVGAERIGGGNGGKSSNDDEFEVHNDGVLVVLSFRMVMFAVSCDG